MIRHALPLLATVLCLSACQTLMPSPEKPYALTASPSAPLQRTGGWVWVDARADVPMDNLSTPDGLVFGDAVMQPRPFEVVQAEFERAVAAHDASAELKARFKGKQIRLEAFEASVGLWAKFSDRQQGNWEFVRVKLTVNVDGQRYEALDVHRFNNSDQPSPVSIPLRNAVSSLVNQIHLF